MKSVSFHQRLRLAIFGAALSLATAAQAQTLPGGQYRGEVELGPVLLDGRYPLLIDDPIAGAAGLSVPGLVALATSPTGALSGTVTLNGQTEDVVGQLTSRAKYIRLTLHGKAGGAGRFFMSAKLKGAEFVGIANLRGRRAPAHLDVSGIGPIRAVYEVALASTANGFLSGSGTLTVARTAVPVTARGRVVNGKGSVTLRGGRGFLRTSTAQVSGNGFTALKWTGLGFGALIQGKQLTFVFDPP